MPEVRPDRKGSEGPALVLDASVLINLLGSGSVAELLSALPVAAVMADWTFREVLSDPSRQMPTPGDRQALVDQGLIRVETLSGEAAAVFLDLVMDPDALDDGEAACIALAVSSGAMPVLDERKGRRVFKERWPVLPMQSTAGLLRLLETSGCLPRTRIRELLFAALRNARMSIIAQEMDWALELLGPELARECRSIPKRSLSRGRAF